MTTTCMQLEKKLPCLWSTFWQNLNPNTYFTLQQECNFLSVFAGGKKIRFSENQSQQCHPLQAKNKTENFSIHTFPLGVTPLGCCNSAGLMFFRLHNNDYNLPLCWIEPTVHLLKVSIFAASSLGGGDILFLYSQWGIFFVKHIKSNMMMMMRRITVLRIF